jgi:hypothetical protein
MIFVEGWGRTGKAEGCGACRLTILETMLKYLKERLMAEKLK